ncbi:hypothetical protein [Streptomyces cyaneofuscatus]|uniref:hypothetical protein n=1 Tax=Streptomyces cyaneofuscatus TaxID=66883 RepID=UPI0036610AE6
MDRIVMLADGSAEAAGTHEELLATSTYRALLAARCAEEVPSISSRQGLRAETAPVPEELR